MAASFIADLRAHLTDFADFTIFTHDFTYNLVEIQFLDFLFSNLIPDKNLEVGRFIESKFGNALLMDKNGYVYKATKKSKSGRKIHWVCRDYDRDKNKKCYAKATTDGIHIIEFHVEHSHPVTEFHRQNYDRKYQIQKRKKNNV